MHNSQKLIDEDERVKYNRIKEESDTNNSNTKSHHSRKTKTSVYSDMEEYIDNNGQIQYTCSNNNNWISSTIKFRALTLSK